MHPPALHTGMMMVMMTTVLFRYARLAHGHPPHRRTRSLAQVHFAFSAVEYTTAPPKSITRQGLATTFLADMCSKL